MNNTEIIISGINMELTEALKITVHEKMQRLLNHEDGILRLKVELEYDTNKKTQQNNFIAKGHIEALGKPMIISIASNDLYKSIDELTDKLDRKLRRQHRLDRVKRKHPHAIEIPSSLPKIQIA